MYIIDGHNLIGKIRDLSLADAEDERKLIERLQLFARLRRKAVEVYFDKAPAGRSGTRSYGLIKAHFVTERSSADQAIAERLRQMGKQARNVVLVTSDRQVTANARSAQAAVVPSEDFAQELAELMQQAAHHPAPSSSPDLESWYQEFGIDADRAEQPIEPTREAPHKPKSKPVRRKHHGFPPKTTRTSQ